MLPSKKCCERLQNQSEDLDLEVFWDFMFEELDLFFNVLEAIKAAILP